MNSSTMEQRRRLRWLLWGGAGSALFIGVMFIVGSVASRKAREANAAKLNAPISLHGPHVSMRPTMGPPPAIPTPAVAPETATETAMLTKAQQAGSDWAAKVQVKDYAPVQSGPGIVVAEPVSVSTQGDFAAFGAGCGRWLHLAVGGWGALGKTPLWRLVDDRRRVLGMPDLRLHSTDVEHFAQGLGITQVALGTLSGTPHRPRSPIRYGQWPRFKPSVSLSRSVGRATKSSRNCPP